MKRRISILIMLLTVTIWAQEKTISVGHFDKVTVNPHIEATFVQGDKEQVQIESCTVSMNKVNTEIKGKTLRIYLDGAKEITKNEKVKENGYKRSKSIYNGTVLKVIITYRNLEELSLRGEEKFVCESPLNSDRFQLKIYGQSQVYLSQVDFNELQASIYGESFLEIQSGRIDRQKYTAYGETRINALGIKNNSTKIVAYGEGSYRVNVSKRLKVTAYGEATIAYKGSPDVDRGIIIGEATIQSID
ncbi:head GIN domain-containing protein [Maribacter sp. HTCC2170]|uniref:head GIN domain-containing protein n=1 Tax=Maribacter sp. (strain HTCC2170 / KCCM 42371) TaxID=313603 RepID=UPI00006B85A9|nr:head GIN domain-containing protein [Maribacter sp. HTCC2170]EAQ99917.1 putative lipoprotein [Maribacter sp. HTCC2170]